MMNSPTSAESKPAAVSPERIQIRIALMLAVAVLAVYAQTAGFDFIRDYDDREYVIDNPRVRQGISLRTIGWAITTFHAANWHPVTWLSHMLDADLYDMEPGRHHLTSVWLHLVNTLLLFHLLRQMTAATWRSAAVAALFALHPLHVESVAMVAQRKDVLSTFFWMLTLQCYVSYATRGSRAWYALTLLCLVFGLLAKPMVVSLPFVMLLLDFWPLGRWRPDGSVSAVSGSKTAGLASLVREKVPHVVLAAAAGAVTVLAQHSKGATASMEVYGFFHRAANASVSTVAYLVKTIWPHPLAVFYPFREAIPAWQWLGSFGLLAAATAAVMVFGRSHRYLVTGWFWYLGTLLPVIGLVQVGAQAMADRYTYIPLIGIFVMVVWGGHAAARRLQLKPAAGACALAGWLVLLGALSWSQTGRWADSRRLFEHAAAEVADNWVAHNNLGSALFRQGEAAAALVHYRTAIEIAPGYADARYNLAVALSLLGRNDEAIRQYRKVLVQSPEHTGALNNLCGELIAAGERAEGIDLCRRAVAIDPQFANPHSNLATAMAAAGRRTEAIALFGRALELDPDNPAVHLSLGELMAADGRIADSLRHFRRALQLDPENEPSCRRAADALMHSGHVAAASEFYACSLRLKPGSADAYNRLGVAFTHQGLREDAIVMFEEALRMDPHHGAAANNLKKALSGR